MNKQIEQFALKCGAWNQVYGNRMFMIDEHFDIEKFARLIVGDCIKIAELGLAQPVATVIRERFGVER